MTDEEDLKRMIKSFRVNELHLLLSFAGRSKIGRKHELVERALDLLQLKSQPLHFKIQHLYNSMQRKRGINVSEPEVVDTVLASAEQEEGGGSWEKDDGISILDERETSKQQSSTQGRHKEDFERCSFQSNSSLQLAVNPLYFPVHPDVKFKKLPFYKVLYELLRPSSLVPQSYHIQQKNSFVFYLTPQQAAAVSLSKDTRPGGATDFTVQGQLRFCLLETTSKQDDSFPSGLIVRVNSKYCPIKEPIAKKKKELFVKEAAPPINITSLMKLNPAEANTIEVQWNTEYGFAYVMAIFLVQKKTSEDLLIRLKSKGIRGADYTRGMIKDKLNEEADSEIVTTSLRVSLMCPLGKMRIRTPCRASTCEHLQCFDASLFIQMNERKPTWVCPVCDNPAEYDKLVIDGYFQEILSSDKLPPDINEIELHNDGSWSSLIIKPEPISNSNENILVKVETEKSLVKERDQKSKVEDKKEEEEDEEEDEEEEDEEIEIEKTVCPPPVSEVRQSNNVITQSRNESGTSEKRKVDEIDLTISDSDDEPLIWYKRRESSKHKRNGVNSNRSSPVVINLDSDSSDSLQLMLTNSIPPPISESLVDDFNSEADLQPDPTAPKECNSILPWFPNSACFF